MDTSKGTNGHQVGEHLGKNRGTFRSKSGEQMVTQVEDMYKTY